MKCEKCQKELPTLGGKWTVRFPFFCHYLGCEVNLCTECNEHYEKALKVFEHEFLTGSPRECATLNVAVRNVDKEEVKRELLEQIRTGNVQLLPAEEPKDRWIPIKYRPLTIEERESLSRYFGIDYEETNDDVAFDCPMPDEGQEILISTSYGVATDVCEHDCTDDGIYMYSLENCGDWEGVNAWMPLPEPYKSEVQDEDS